jgi:hypothetical protein
VTAVEEKWGRVEKAEKPKGRRGVIASYLDLDSRILNIAWVDILRR